MNCSTKYIFVQNLQNLQIFLIIDANCCCYIFVWSKSYLGSTRISPTLPSPYEYWLFLQQDLHFQTLHNITWYFNCQTVRHVNYWTLFKHSVLISHTFRKYIPVLNMYSLSMETLEGKLYLLTNKMTKQFVENNLWRVFRNWEFLFFPIFSQRFNGIVSSYFYSI